MDFFINFYFIFYSIYHIFSLYSFLYSLFVIFVILSNKLSLCTIDYLIYFLSTASLYWIFTPSLAHPISYPINYWQYCFFCAWPSTFFFLAEYISTCAPKTAIISEMLNLKVGRNKTCCLHISPETN